MCSAGAVLEERSDRAEWEDTQPNSCMYLELKLTLEAYWLPKW